MKYGFEIIDKTVCYDGFFRLERYRLRHELFAGGWCGEIVREMLERGDAAALVLYDPDLDSVIMIEQFRIGAMSDANGPWLLEVVAGIIEDGETPEDVVRREAMEEAGVEVQELLPVAVFNLSPGGCSENIHLYCGRVDASHAGGIHGLAHEGEDIQVRVVPYAQLRATLDAGGITNATALIALQWLVLHRDELRDKWA